MVYGQWPANWWNTQLQMTDSFFFLFAEPQDLKTCLFHFEIVLIPKNCNSETSEAASHLGGLGLNKLLHIRMKSNCHLTFIRWRSHT